MPTAAAEVHEGEKESLVYCGTLCTVAATVDKLQYTRVAAAVHEPQYTSRSTQGIKQYCVQLLVYCSAAVHKTLLCLSLPWWVEFSLPQGRNWSPFIPSQHTTCSSYLKIRGQE